MGIKQALQAVARPLAERVLRSDIQAMQETVNKLSEAVTEIRAEERGWVNISQGFVPWELTGEQRQKVIQKVRELYKKNPLAGQIVDLKRYFTMGQGISFKAEDPGINEILKTFWKDESNKWFQRQTQLSDDLEIDGEFFIRFFVDKFKGRVTVRCIPAYQITDIILDKDDAETPLFYKREWVELRWNETSKMYEIAKYHTGTDADYIPADEILHVKVGAPLYAKFGNSPLYRVLNWIDAYTEWLEDRMKLNKARGAFAWKKTIKSLPSMVNNAVGAVVNALNKITGSEKAIPPKTGGVIVQNEGVDWDIVNAKIGADDAGEDGRAIKLMICAGSGIFEHYLGDAKVGNLASTKSMELPMLKMFEWRQKLFEDAVFLPIFRRVIRAAVDAGELPEKIKVTRQEKGKTYEIEIPAEEVCIDIDFPPLVLKEIKDLTDSLVKQIEAGIKSRQTAAMELGVEDWEQEKVLMAAEEEEAAARQRQWMTDNYPPFNPDKGQGDNFKRKPDQKQQQPGQGDE